MNIRNRISYIFLHFEKIGIIPTLSYFVQRVILFKNAFIILKLKGLPHHIYLRNRTYDTNIFYQIFIADELETKYNGSINNILDLGANIGLSTLFFLRKFPETSIISVEPDVNNFKVLRKNTRNYENVKIINIGIYGKNCALYLVDVGEGEASYRVLEFSKGYRVINEINCIDISALKLRYGIEQLDIIKMDIEGSESSCLIDYSHDWLNHTKYLLVEIHEGLIPGLTKLIQKSIPTSFLYSKLNEYSIFYNHQKK